METIAGDPAGRFIGSGGHREAEEYLTDTLRGIGARVRKHSFAKEISLPVSWMLEYRNDGNWQPLDAYPGIGNTSRGLTQARPVYVDHGTADDYAELGTKATGKIAVARLWKTHETQKVAQAAREGAAAILWYNEYVDDFYSAACDYVESAIPGFSIKKSTASFLIHERPTLRLAIESARRKIPGRNIIADLGGETPKILLTAHYDTRPRTPGANDDASGVICCLGLARTLASMRGVRERIRIVLFDAEETGCCGSETYVAHLVETGEIEEVGAVINFDSAGWPNLALLEGDREVALSKDLSVRAQRIFRQRKYAIITARSRTGKSDHTPFARHGVPSLWFSDYPNYLRHSPQDTVGNIDYTTVMHVIDVVTELVRNWGA